MRCENCGAEVRPGIKFCPQCGSKVIQPEPASQQSYPHDLSAVWPEWQIVKQLGRGSYGVVYQVMRTENNLQSNAAVKVISIPSDASEVDSLRSEGLDINGTRTYFKGIVDDFVSEIRLMESFKGIQNIVSVEDYKVVERKNTVGWDIYIRMELLTPFNAHLQSKTLSQEEVIKLGVDICNALEICGKRKIIHRDVKPENIFINDFGFYKLGDFGIARKLENLTGGLSQKGTYNYMAPEVATSQNYDARADIYSLGIVLYRLMNNNRLPFLNDDAQLLNPHERKNAADRRIRGEALPAPCGATAEMANVILRACAFNPDARFATPADMKQALEQVAQGTYQMVELGLDQTVDFSSAYQGNETAQVRKPQQPKASAGSPSDSIFGNRADAIKKQQKAKKKKKAKVIAIAVLVGILAIAITLSVLFLRSPAFGVYRSLNKQDCQTAMTQYDGQIKENFIQKLLLRLMLNGHADKVCADYEAGEMEYESAIAVLETLKSMEFENAEDFRQSLMTSYADRICEWFETGNMEFDIAAGELETLVTAGLPEAGEKLTAIMELRASQILTAFQNGETAYQAAEEELQGLINKGVAVAQENRNKIMKAYADDTIAKYEAGDITYTTASNIFTQLNSDGYTEAATMLSKITEEYNAETALKQADSYYSNGDYKSAIAEYAKIPEGNENYATAQQKLEKVYADYVASIVKAAEQFCKTGNYQDAIRQIQTAYDVLPDDVDTTDLDAAKEESLTAYKTAVSNEVTALTAEGKYTEAFTLIDETIAFSDDEYFTTLKANTEKAYVTSVTAEVNKSMDGGDYKGALKAADTALTVLPGNADLTALKKTVIDKTPTPLNNLVVIDSSHYKYSADIFTDSYGFVYDGYHWFEWCRDTARAVYNLNGEYTKFRCSFVAAQSTSSAVTFTVGIYLDGKLVHTVTDFNKIGGKKDVVVDVTDATRIAVKITSNYEKNCDMAMVNAYVE